MRRALLVVGALVVAGALSAWLFGWLRWRSVSNAALSRLEARGGAPPAAVYHEAELRDLPAPVQRYLRRALRDGQPVVARARFEQSGQFLIRERPESWVPFTATEDFRVWPPAFVWLARLRMAPGVAAHVRDSYLDGTGAMRVELAKLVPMVDQHDTPEMASGALVRHLAEAVWFPTALLPSAGVRWSAIDDSTARATLGDEDHTVWMDFRFDANGDIASSSTTSRAHVDENGSQLLPWGGRYWNWADRDGMRVPLEADVAWEIDGRRAAYFRCRLTSAQFTFAKAAR